MFLLKNSQTNYLILGIGEMLKSLISLPSSEIKVPAVLAIRSRLLQFLKAGLRSFTENLINFLHSLLSVVTSSTKAAMEVGPFSQDSS